jgi:hypothetical protein
MEDPKTMEEALVLINSLKEKTKEMEKIENDNKDLKKRNTELYSMLMAKPIRPVKVEDDAKEAEPLTFEECLEKVKKGEIK